MSIVQTRAQTKRPLGGKGQVIPYAATITPDPTAGGSRKIITLTGNITVANPAVTKRSIGAMLSFLFIQDATGGRTVTWGSDYQVNWTPTTTANKRNSIDVMWDGAKWAQVSEKVNV